MKRKFIAIGIAIIALFTGCGRNVGDVFYEGDYVKFVIIESNEGIERSDFILEDAYTGDLYYYLIDGYGRTIVNLNRTIDGCK